jgi:transposase
VTPVHFTQTCDEEVPQLITHVETTHAGFPDGQALAAIHSSEAARNMLPEHHLVDAGSIDSTNLIQSRKSMLWIWWVRRVSNH